MTNDFETIDLDTLTAVKGGDGVTPAMQAKGDFTSFLGTGVNGPPSSTQMGSGGAGGSLPPLM